MVIDIAKCVGCYACTVACKVENGTPPGIWYAPVFTKEIGKYPNAKMIFIPTLCNHCKDPPCMKACPTSAITIRSDGIVLVDQNKCCGSRACMAACPYGAIHFYEEEKGVYGPGAGLVPFEEVAYKKYQVGTTQKCTFCAHKITPEGKYTADPACVSTCPTNCRIFGDLEDPNSTPSRLIRERNGVQPRAEAGTNPSVYYVL